MKNGKKSTLLVLAGVLLTGCGGESTPAPAVTVTERVPAPVVTTPSPSPSKSKSAAEMLFGPQSSEDPTPAPSVPAPVKTGLTDMEKIGRRIEFCNTSMRGNLTPGECLKATVTLSDGRVVFK
ncbi:hypothetical protein ACFYUL_17910 [Streptomyces sp. NPDC004311]|uniref:hypothetical protein n=1 Tax=Streptomyces sp. NPDC004311 TaxID=3364698 RepID=UPI003685C070